MEKVVKKYSKIFEKALKLNNFDDIEGRKKAFEERLTCMYGSDAFTKHNVYPTIDVPKVYAVIAMCLELKKDDLENNEIIDIVNSGFADVKKVVAVIGKVVNVLPNVYQIVKKWNINDHEKRVEDGSIEYGMFEATDEKIEYWISCCMYVKMFEYYGIRRLCKIFCLMDIQAYNKITRNVKFVRHADLSTGACCHDEIFNKKYLKG